MMFLLLIHSKQDTYWNAMNQRISTDFLQACNKQRNDLLDKTIFIGLHPTRVNLRLCHLTAN